MTSMDVFSFFVGVAFGMMIGLFIGGILLIKQNIEHDRFVDKLIKEKEHDLLHSADTLAR